jgi:hypothetical protein
MLLASLSEETKMILTLFLRNSPKQADALFEYLKAKMILCSDPSKIYDDSLSSEENKDRLMANARAMKILNDIVTELSSFKIEQKTNNIGAIDQARLSEFR